jgi:hypothetical protein
MSAFLRLVDSELSNQRLVVARHRVVNAREIDVDIDDVELRPMAAAALRRL